MAFDKAGGAARHPDQIAPPPVPRPKAAPETPAKVPPHVHPANRPSPEA
jgi:hypothetical protein